MTGTPRPCYRSISIVADGRLGVCDGAHWAFVMKKVKGPALRFAIGWATRLSTSIVPKGPLHGEDRGQTGLTPISRQRN